MMRLSRWLVAGALVVMAVLVGVTVARAGLISISGGRGSSVTSATFPLSVSADSRYLVEADGDPFPILGRSYWGIIGLSPTNYQAAINDAVSKGFNAIEFRSPNASWQDNFVPFNGASQLPFTTKVGGGAYTGNVTETPDFTTPNEPYWQYLDTFIAYCETQGVAVLWFPAYVGWTSGYDTSSEGWMQVMVDNGATRMTTYGAYVANRYKSYGNIIWMLGGDKGAQDNPFVGSQITVEQALIDGLKSVSGQASTQYAAEWDSDTTGISETNFGDELTLNSSYSFYGLDSTWSRNGYTASPTKPTFLVEEPYDEEGSDGTNKNANATQPTRRFIFRSVLDGIGGYMEGNGYLIHFFSGYASHFSTETQNSLASFNAWWPTVPWYRLVPHGLGSIGTLITAGRGTIDTDAYVAAAATPTGDLLVAYAGPTFTSFTVDRTKLSGSFTAKWVDPVSGAETAIGGSHPNTGTEAFNDPGNNSGGDGDWFLVLTVP
jgi:hypothetical protein